MSLPTPIDEILDPVEVDERTVHRARSRLFASLDRPARRRARVWPWAVAGLAAVASIGAAILVLWPSAELPEKPLGSEVAPLRLAGRALPSELRATSQPRVLRFEDGSRVELAPDATLRVARNEGGRIDLVLARGEALFEIPAHGSRRWRVAMGRWEVEVVGTRFRLTRSPTDLRVEVMRGLVRLTEGGEARLLGAGAVAERSLRPPARDRAPLEAEAPARPPVDRSARSLRPPASDRVPREAAAPARAPIDRSARWRARAAAGDAEGAYALLAARFGREVRAARDVDVLFALADVARLSGHPERAVEPLTRIVDDFHRDRGAAVAAFTLGRLHGESLHRPADAARAFERALALGLPRELQEPAASRRLVMWSRAGHPARARAAACEYLTAHPEGPSAERALRRCSEPSGPSTGPEAAP